MTRKMVKTKTNGKPRFKMVYFRQKKPHKQKEKLMKQNRLNSKQNNKLNRKRLIKDIILIAMLLANKLFTTALNK